MRTPCSTGPACELYPYQREAVDAVLGALDAERPQCLHLATGGGKTRVANEIVARWHGQAHKAPVLWVSKDWRLLEQASEDLSRHAAALQRGRLGGAADRLRELPEHRPAHVVYTTIQTLARRLSHAVLDRVQRCSFLIWDESHWGERGRAARILRQCRRLGIPVLGLTATPRRDSGYEIAYSKSFMELVRDGYLARPLVEMPVATGISWRPRFDRDFQDVCTASLEELANNRARNRCIVEQYRSNAAKYGKTIVFACGKAHASGLARLFDRAGITVRVVHCDQSGSEISEALALFKRGAVQVLVNVEMLTHGVDVPDAQTVFLCRPTTSDILFTQMVGRGARRDAQTGKTTFHVVEFTDNVEEHGALFQTAQRHFDGASWSGGARAALREERPVEPLRAHHFDPTGAPTWIPDSPDVPEALRGLWYRQGQTFGIEIELTAPGYRGMSGERWHEIAEALRRCLVVPTGGLVASRCIEEYRGILGGKDHAVWNVERDDSVGWEITSRVLCDEEGFAEIARVCAVLEQRVPKLGLRLSHRTGLHVHLGWCAGRSDELRRLVRLTRLFEPALATLVAPSRIARFSAGRYGVGLPNPYCNPVAEAIPGVVLERGRPGDVRAVLRREERSRYLTLNPRPLAGRADTVEVRLHSGTCEARKILLWVSLWQQLLWAASHLRDVPTVADSHCIIPDGDIVALARSYLPSATQPEQQALIRRLHERRLQILEVWKRHPELARWVRFAERWQAPA